VTNNSGSGGLSSGAIAGIVVGCVIGGLCVLCIIVYLCLVCARSQKEKNTIQHETDVETASSAPDHQQLEEDVENQSAEQEIEMGEHTSS